jgi:hypothetical protein
MLTRNQDQKFGETFGALQRDRAKSWSEWQDLSDPLVPNEVLDHPLTQVGIPGSDSGAKRSVGAS